MTAQEAIRRIKEHNKIHFEKEKGKCFWITQALEMAIGALELQTLKFPQGSISSFYRCPECKNDLWEGQKYCENCGQALDWRDNNDNT